MYFQEYIFMAVVFFLQAQYPVSVIQVWQIPGVVVVTVFLFQKVHHSSVIQV